MGDWQWEGGRQRQCGKGDAERGHFTPAEAKRVQKGSDRPQGSPCRRREKDQDAGPQLCQD